MMMSTDIAHTVFGLGIIQRLVEQHYALGGAVSCTHYYSGSNVHYLVEAAGRRYVLRILGALLPWNRANDRAPAGVGFEMELLLFLKDRGVAVCCPVRRADGSYFGEIAAPEGVRYYTLFDFIDGKKPERFDAGRAFGYGRAVARLHSEMARFSTASFKYHLGPAYLLDETLELFASHGTSVRADALPYLTCVAGDVRRAMQELPQDGPYYGIIHGDIHVGNALEDNAGGVAFIDFETAGHGWRIYDIATFTGMLKMGWGPLLAPEASIESINQAFLDGYQAVSSIEDVELRALALFERARLFEFVGFWMSEIASGKSGIKNWEKQLDTVIEVLQRWDGLAPDTASPGRRDVSRPVSLSV